MLRETIDQFLSYVNDAIREGTVPPKSKMTEHIPRNATCLPVFCHAMVELLASADSTQPPEQISTVNFTKCDSICATPGRPEGHFMSGERVNFFTVRVAYEINFFTGVNDN